MCTFLMAGVHCLEISLLLDVLTNLNMDNPEGNQPSLGSLGSADSGINEQPVPPAPVAAPVSENYNGNNLFLLCIDLCL